MKAVNKFVSQKIAVIIRNMNIPISAPAIGRGKPINFGLMVALVLLSIFVMDSLMLYTISYASQFQAYIGLAYNGILLAGRLEILSAFAITL